MIKKIFRRFYNNFEEIIIMIVRIERVIVNTININQRILSQNIIERKQKNKKNIKEMKGDGELKIRGGYNFKNCPIKGLIHN